MVLSEAVSNRIKTILKERNLTQYGLFKLSGVPQSTISAILKCENKSVVLSTIYDICSGLGMELSDFFAAKEFKLENLED